MSSNEKIERLVSETNEVLDTMEQVAEYAPQIKTAIRRMKALDEILTVLEPIVGDLPDVPTAEALLPVKTTAMAERLEMLQKALDAVGLLPDIPEDAIRDVMARAERIFSATRTGGSTSKPTIRGIGVPIRVACGCGFERESKNGDWTSIRYQAKKHAETCSVANPDSSGEWANDLDRARNEIVTLGHDKFVTGGLTFTLPEGRVNVVAVSPNAVQEEDDYEPILPPVEDGAS